ncbi:uncharacterized protein IUM83_12493 [Phytophthora cinnamomi]|uniref:uncharacterized protein n=1 Tax=Phytophthora cinnamomi TaxID=4785 RepID=UPI00355937F4|nr:hypothetical protein IUM83_12493 [Phytophthora cinnamomi]
MRVHKVWPGSEKARKTSADPDAGPWITWGEASAGGARKSKQRTAAPSGQKGKGRGGGKSSTRSAPGRSPPHRERRGEVSKTHFAIPSNTPTQHEEKRR